MIPRGFLMPPTPLTLMSKHHRASAGQLCKRFGPQNSSDSLNRQKFRVKTRESRHPMPIPGAKNLDKSQRTALIKAVSLALGQRTWDELEAMVGELGLWIPAQDDRLGRASTVEGALSDANDSQLDVLAGIVLSPEFNLDWERLNPWDPGKFRLFLSHAHEDRVFVGAVAASLSGKGIHGFAAHEDIEVHAEWAHVIEYALDTADALVAFVSEPSTSSFWCNQEIGWALGRHLLVASVRLDRAPVGFTSRFQAQRAADPAQLAENLWNFLLGRNETGESLTRSVIGSLEASEHWEQATERSATLTSLTWNAATLSQLEEAVRSSRKLDFAWHVFRRVRQVFEAHGYKPDDEVAGYLRAREGKR